MMHGQTKIKVGSPFGYRGRQKYVSCPNFQTACLTHLLLLQLMPEDLSKNMYCHNVTSNRPPRPRYGVDV